MQNNFSRNLHHTPTMHDTITYVQEVVIPFTMRIDVSLFSIKIIIPLNKYFGLKFVCVKSKTFSNQMKDKSC